MRQFPTNIYTPPVRPINGLFEQLKAAGSFNAMFYGWEPLRDIARPNSLKVAAYQWAYSADNTDRILTNKAIECMEELKPDFVFLYMVETDEKGGHDSGWMSEPYLNCISMAIDNVKSVIEKFGDEYTVIVTADHGGHDRGHGTEREEDMTIPMFFCGKEFEAGHVFETVSILDLAPTIAHIMGVEPAREWEGKSLL